MGWHGDTPGLTGGGGADDFVFAPGSGRDRITDFANGSDQVRLSAYGFASFAEARAEFTADGGGVLFRFGTDTLHIDGLTLATLDVSDLIL